MPAFSRTQAWIKSLNRESTEQALNFDGLIVFENRLKTCSLSVVRQLNVARIRTVMITGDNLLTALSVADQCFLADPDKTTYIVQVGVLVFLPRFWSILCFSCLL